MQVAGDAISGFGHTAVDLALSIHGGANDTRAEVVRARTNAGHTNVIDGGPVEIVAGRSVRLGWLGA